MLSAYPLPDAWLPVRGRTTRSQQRQPAGSAEGQLRFDYRLNAKTCSPTATASTAGRRWTRSAARSPSRAPTGIGPNTTQTASWTSTIKNNLVNEVDLHLLARPGVHQRVPRDRPLPAQQVRHQLSVHLPGEQGDPGQDPDDHDRQLHGDRRRAVSLLVRRVRSTSFNNATT